MRNLYNSVALCAVMAFATTGFSTQAWAQDAPAPEVAESDEGIEDIVVTAQRRETNLQETPLAISAFSGERLEESGIDDLTQAQALVPSLHVGQEQDGFKVSLRGVSLQGTSSISDPGVAFYIDDFYIARPAGGSAIMYDVNRIEVLRGPQGTLYGRNATGGVVNIISNEPSSNFEGELGATYGARDLTELRGLLNIPLGDHAATRFSIVHTQEEGYIENRTRGEELLGTDGDTTARGQLLVRGDDDLEVLVSASYSYLDGTGVPMQFLERAPFAPPPVTTGGPPPVRRYRAYIGPDPTDPLVVYNDEPSWNQTETGSAFVRVQNSFGPVDLYVQGGHFEQNTNLHQDFDGSPLPIAIFDKLQETQADSLELRLTSNGEGPLEWILGGYYFSEDTYIFRDVFLRGTNSVAPALPIVDFALPVPFLLHEWGESTTTAIFGSATYSLSDDFRVTAGLRYTEDEKTGTLINPAGFGGPVRPTRHDEAQFSRLTWNAGLEWDVSEDVLAFLNVSSGYKAGGFNITSNGDPYDEEVITAYELGIKSNPFNGRAQINLDIFYYDYQDMQMTTLATPDGLPGQYTANAAGATVYGVELETQFELTEGLLATFSYAYTNAEFDEYFRADERDLNPLGVEDMSGNKLPYVAENVITAGLQYERDIGAGTLVASINTKWQDDMFLREYNIPTIDLVPAYTRTDASVTYRFGADGVSITGFVNNIEDEVQRNNIYLTPGFVGTSATTVYSRPRTWGVRLNYEF